MNHGRVIAQVTLTEAHEDFLVIVNSIGATIF